MEKQHDVKLSLKEVQGICAKLHVAAYEMKYSDLSAEKRQQLAEELDAYYTMLETKLEQAKAKNLVYFAFDGTEPDLFMYPRKPINLSGIDYTKEYYDEVARCLREQGYPDHAEYVEKNTAELDKEYQEAYGILISESQEAELETLKVDMYVNGGYGDETADSAALNRMAELERQITTNHDEQS